VLIVWWIGSMLIGTIFDPPRSRGGTDSIKALTVDEAKALAKQEVHLSLNGLTSISDEVAEALAQHRGELYLNGLTSLSDKAAKALAQHRGYLELWGVTKLSDKAAEAFRSAKANATGTKPEFVFNWKFRQ